MLARAAATEIRPGYQNRRLLKTRLRQHELVIALIPPVVEEPRRQSAAYDGFQKLLRDYLIGIHVRPIQRCHDSGEILERLHCHESDPYLLTNANPVRTAADSDFCGGMLAASHPHTLA